MLDLVLPAVVRVLDDFEVEDDGLALAVSEAVVAVMQVQTDSLGDALARSVAEGRAAGKLGASDEAAIVAANQVARKVDNADAYFQELAADAVDHRLRPPSQDNVSLPVFLKYLDALGLTPAARKEKAAPSKGGASGRVAAFRSREQQARSGRTA